MASAGIGGSGARRHPRLIEAKHADRVVLEDQRPHLVLEAGVLEVDG
jgi:hypothetical protein